jgi:hypothetical protein
MPAIILPKHRVATQRIPEYDVDRVQLREPRLLVHGINVTKWLSIGSPLYAVNPEKCLGADNAVFALPNLSVALGTRPAIGVPRSLTSYWGGTALAMRPTSNSQYQNAISSSVFGQVGNMWNTLSGVAAVLLLNDGLHNQNQTVSAYGGTPRGGGNAYGRFSVNPYDNTVRFYYQDSLYGSELFVNSAGGAISALGNWHLIGYAVDIVNRTGNLFINGTKYIGGISINSNPQPSYGLISCSFGGCNNDYSHGQIFGPQAHWTSLVSDGVMSAITGNKDVFLSLFSA